MNCIFSCAVEYIFCRYCGRDMPIELLAHLLTHSASLKVALHYLNKIPSRVLCRVLIQLAKC